MPALAARRCPRGSHRPRRALQALGLGALALLLPALLVAPVAATPGEDAFIAGYATAVLERELALPASRVTVTDGVVRVVVPSLAGGDRERIVAALAGLRGVVRVEVVEALSPPHPPGAPPATAPAVTAPAPPADGFLPEGYLFLPLVADPRWPHFGATYQRYLGDRELRNVGATSFGETFALYRGPAFLDGQWELGLQAAVFAIFDLDAASTDLVNADYFVGVPVSYRRGAFSGMARVFHQSSHLGDEFLLRSRLDRVNLSYEGVDLTLSYELGRLVRVYAGGGYLLRTDPKSLRPWSTQAGLELRSPWTFWGDTLRPLAAVDLKSRQENDWDGDVSLRAGVQFETGPVFGRRLQLMLEYFRGHSPHGQFYRREIEYLGLGIHLYLF